METLILIVAQGVFGFLFFVLIWSAAVNAAFISRLCFLSSFARQEHMKEQNRETKAASTAALQIETKDEASARPTRFAAAYYPSL
jgi:hypothetical protein